jgi:hypothetical protein
MWWSLMMKQIELSRTRQYCHDKRPQRVQDFGRARVLGKHFGRSPIGHLSSTSTPITTTPRCASKEGQWLNLAIEPS